jgi:hypothetical protein
MSVTTVMSMLQRADPTSPALLAMLQPFQHRTVQAQCARCDRILGDLEAPHAEMFAYIDHFLAGSPSRTSPSGTVTPRPHIRRGEYGSDADSIGGKLLFGCKCGADIQRNKVRLVPAFVRAAAAGTSIRL